jgi:hypothetical protein
VVCHFKRIGKPSYSGANNKVISFNHEGKYVFKSNY